METVTLPRSVLLVLSNQLRSALACLGELGRSSDPRGSSSDERVVVVHGAHRHAVDMRHAQAALLLAEQAIRQPPRQPAQPSLQRRPMAPPVGALSRMPPSTAAVRQRTSGTVVELKGNVR